VTFNVAPGECLALVGPSGCGKTTLLRVIAGLDAPSSGIVKFDGRDVADVPSHRRGVAMLFQRPALMPTRSVRHNLGWAWTLQQPCRLFGIGRARERGLSDIAKLLQLADVLDRPVQELSGGQQQRVALGRCLLRQAKLLLFDEPLGQLDAPLRMGLRRQIGALVKERGLTAIFVTHDPEEALAFGDRVAVMHEGRLVQIDEPMVLRRFPANCAVAQWVHEATGGMNQIAGSFVREDMDTFFECAFGRWPIAVTVLKDLRESLFKCENFNADATKVHMIVGIAAQDVWCDADAAPGDNAVRLVLPVLAQESTTAGDWVIAGDSRGQWVGRLASRLHYRRGDKVTMVFTMERAFWFDSATGRTLHARTG